MHYKEAKSILTKTNGMNIYRGCSHGCIYCDSRSVCYQLHHPFEDIEVKSNAIILLEKTLQSKRKKCMIGTGSMSDPYIPLEEKLKLTRQAIEIVAKYHFGFTILTKSDLILRDIDLLEKINQQTKCVVQMTLTTYDEGLCKILEPNVVTTKRRFEVLMACKDRNIPTVVWLDPILPYINDTIENLEGILLYCIAAKVRGIICFGFGMTLRQGNREYYYHKLDQHFPGLKQKYQYVYGDAYQVVSPKNNQLMALFVDVCQKNNILYKVEDVFFYLHQFEEKRSEQLQLF